MRDWNVLVTINAGGWKAAKKLLRPLGQLGDTPFYNVLVLHADEPRALLDAIDAVAASDPRAGACVAHVAPADATFTFSTAEEFEARARAAVLAYAPALAGKSFHVRLHRRGFKGRISTQAEERALAEALIETCSAAGTPARISFENPDLVVTIETVGPQAGVALLSRDDLARHPRLHPG